MTPQEALSRLVKEDLALDAQIELLRHLTLEKLDADILTSAVLMLREHMIPVDLPVGAVDMAGTGGDKSNTFNISTTSTLVAAAAGVPIAKHGNVSISSKSGGVNLLQSLGVYLPDTAPKAQREFQKNNLVFLFAQSFHPIFKKFGPARKALAQEGVITIFNILGPLLNPAKVSRQICGVFKPELVELMAETLCSLNHERALIIYGNGLDEFSLTGENQVAELRDGVVTYEIKTPKDFGFQRCDLTQLKGGTPDENAQITKNILNHTIQGPMKDIVVLNAGAAIYVADDMISFEVAIEKAREALESGKAFAVLERLTA